MNSFELIEKYLPESIDKYFAHDSKSVLLEKGTKFIDVSFKETGYVKIASMLMDGLSDYYQTQQNSVDLLSPATARPDSVGGPGNAAYAAYAGNVSSGGRDGFAIGGVDVSWEIFRLQWVRGKQFRIDYISNEETAGIIIGNALEEFHRLKVIPEVDACRFSFIADQASVSLGNMVSEAPTAANIISKFNSVFEWMFEHGVPEEEQVIFVNPAIMTLIRNSTELTKFLTQGDYRSEAGLDFTVEKYMGRPIVQVPSDRFFTNCLITQNGYRAQASSYVINFMVVSTKATVPVRKLEYEKIYGPELSGLAGFHGYIINYLLYHGIFVPRNKVPGIYVSVSSSTAASTKVNLMSVQTVAGASQYHWVLKNYFTNPSGLRGQIVYMEYDNTAASGYKKDGFSVGSTLTGTLNTDYKFGTIGADVSEAAGSVSAFFALVDAAGTIIASTGSTPVALQQHA